MKTIKTVILSLLLMGGGGLTSFINPALRYYIGQADIEVVNSDKIDVYNRVRIIIAASQKEADAKFRNYLKTNSQLKNGKISTVSGQSSYWVWEIKEQDETGIVIIK